MATPSIPGNLPGPNNLFSILFKDMKTYLFKIQLNSIIQNHEINGDRCRRFVKQQTGNPQHQGKRLLACLKTTISDTKIIETLYYSVDEVFAGSVIFTRIGKDLSPSSFDKILNYGFYLDKKATETTLVIGHLELFIMVKRFEKRILTTLELNESDISLKYLDQWSELSYLRTMLLQCDDCDGVRELKVYAYQNEALAPVNIDYRIDGYATEVTPSFFLQHVGYFVLKPLVQLNTSIPSSFDDDLRWPSVD